LFGSTLSYDDKAKTKFLLSDKVKPLEPLRALVAEITPFEALHIEQAVKAWADQAQIGLGAIAQPARTALTGKTVSPGIFEVMELLGRDTTLARLDAALAMNAG
jgi:glutamyl-tRNA synthetase